MVPFAKGQARLVFADVAGEDVEVVGVGIEVEGIVYGAEELFASTVSGLNEA